MVVDNINMIAEYYYAKIDAGNCAAEDYLNGYNEINVPAIPIYFDENPDNKKDFLDGNSAREQGRNFFRCGEENKNKYIIVINKGVLSAVVPIGDVQFVPSDGKRGHREYVKLLPVKLINKKLVTEIPAILASITANTYYYSGTFRQIRDNGNIKAIESVLNNGKISCSKIGKFDSLLECLSSFELETLVAKIFEEYGCFVPAYRGGNMKGLDIFAENDLTKDIDIGGIIVPAKTRKSIQVKRGGDMISPPTGIDFLITADKSRVKYGANWFVDAIKYAPKTTQWLKRSLNWLPSTYLNANGL